MYHFGILFVFFYQSLDAVGSVSQSETERHLELGKNFLAKGELKDALTHYHAAVDADPNNYLTRYKRGTVYLALGNQKFALLDLTKVLELKPDFRAARSRRGEIFLKQAEFDKAKKDLMHVLTEDPNQDEAADIISKIENTEQLYHLAQSLVHQGSYPEAIDMLTQVIEVCPWSPHLRELRAEANIASGDYMRAISDIKSTTKMLSDNTEGYHKLSSMLYRIGHIEDSLKEIRECLKLDPEHKQCFPFYKHVKKVVKKYTDAVEAEQARDTDTCISSAEDMLKLEKRHDNVRFLAHHLLCKCYRKDDPGQAVSHCQEALKIRRELDILCDSSEAYLAAKEYDDAIREVKEALELDPSSRRANELHKKAQQWQKMSESRDYYEILGVDRTASKREIIKAYRKQAQKWHPDNYQEGTKKKLAQKKFIDIAAAKEVLTDDEKRAKFDRGEDPLDPESGMHQSSHFRNPFHDGSPFQFRFHFN